MFVSVLASENFLSKSFLFTPVAPRLSAIFNRFDLSASNGQHCGEYRVIYHKNNGNSMSVLNSLSCHGLLTNVLERT
jgi:hypothetical protein